MTPIVSEALLFVQFGVILIAVIVASLLRRDWSTFSCMLYCRLSSYEHVACNEMKGSLCCVRLPGFGIPGLGFRWVFPEARSTQVFGSTQQQVYIDCDYRQILLAQARYTLNPKPTASEGPFPWQRFRRPMVMLA